MWQKPVVARCGVFGGQSWFTYIVYAECGAGIAVCRLLFNPGVPNGNCTEMVDLRRLHTANRRHNDLR